MNKPYQLMSNSYVLNKCTFKIYTAGILGIPLLLRTGACMTHIQNIRSRTPARH